MKNAPTVKPTFLINLSPKKYKLNNGTSGRYHYGFIAQDVNTLMKKTIGDSGLLVKNAIGTTDDKDYTPINYNDENTFYYGLRYEEFISPMVKTIQQLHQEIEELKEQILLQT